MSIETTAPATVHADAEDPNEAAVSYFPIDRAQADHGPSPSSISIDIPPETLEAERASEKIAFAALFALARLSNQQTARVAVVKGAGDEARIVAADFIAGASLREAMATLRFEAARPGETFGLALMSTTAGNPIGADAVLRHARTEEGLRLTLDFDASQIAPVTARDFLEKIARVAAALAETPDAPCAAVELTTEAARGLAPDLSRSLVPQCFESVPATFLRVAALHAGQPAIAATQENYSYGDLSRAVRLVASRLRDAGLRAGDVVAIHGFMSFGVIAGMIGTMAAGGAMVAVDLALPDERRKLIVDIAKPQFHIRVGPAQRDDGALVIADWPDAAAIAALPDLPFAPPAHADGAAYVFFTSGSTGVPKGVLGSHRGLAHFLDWQRGRFPIGPGDRAAQITALSFDVVLRDALFPLTSGACLHCPESGALLDARRMLRWIEASKIGVMHCVPSLMKAWLRATGDDAPFRSLKYIFFAGEPLTDSLLHSFRRAAGEHTRILNLYGPTETTLAKLCCEIARIEPGVQPVGTPQPGVDALIVRDRRFRCGLWETGEIAIRTPYRSYGYLDNAELTNQAFLPNPCRDDADDLIYYTGDLGRLRPDGKIEIFGRIDGQIKIRGVRIEPSEVEAQILKLTEISDAAITALVGADGDKILVAIVAPAAPVAAAARAEFAHGVREALRRRMIDAMTPAHVLVADALPYLPNGKIDRTAIRKMAETVKAVAGGAEAAPDTEADTPAGQLIRLWRPIFPNKQVSADSSFIGLEGDSLSYVSALIELENVLGNAPEDWHLLTIRELARFTSDAPPTLFSTMEGSIALRALGISLVVANHFEITHVNGATSILFLVSGSIFGTLQLKEVLAKDSAMPILRLIRSVLLPYYLFLVPIAFLMRPAGVPIWPTLLLVADLLPHDSPLLIGSSYLWYIHCLVHILLAFLLCYYVSRRLGRGDKAVYDALAVLSAIGLFGTMLLPRLLYPDLEAARSPDNVLYYAPVSHVANFTLGAAAAIVQKKLKHAVMAVTALYALPGMAFFGKGPAILMPFSAFFLFYHNNVKVPRVAAPLIYNIAGGSLFIYFFHFQVQHFVVDVLGLSVFVAFVAALAAGVAAWRLWGLLQDRLIWRRRRAETDK